jgi:anti-sigma factor RsiW
MTCPVTADVGAYVLGVLDADERRQVEEHVAACEVCAAELAELRGLPRLLEPVEATPSPELFERVAAAARAPRARRTRRLLVAAAVVAVLGAGIGAAVWQAGNADRTWSASADGVELTVTASEARDGSALDITVDGLEPGGRCRIVVGRPVG